MEQDRPDIARRRARWRRYQKGIDPTRLVFIDETWTKTNMAPLRGWGERGERLTGKSPQVAGERIPFSPPCAATAWAHLDRAGAGSTPEAWRCGGPGQPRQPQGQSRPASHQGRWCTPAILTRIQPRSESYRAVLREAEALAQTPAGQNLRNPVPRNSQYPRRSLAGRVRKLHSKLWIRSHQIVGRSSGLYPPT